MSAPLSGNIKGADSVISVFGPVLFHHLEVDNIINKTEHECHLRFWFQMDGVKR